MNWDRVIYYGTAVLGGIILAAILLKIADGLCGCVPPLGGAS